MNKHNLDINDVYKDCKREGYVDFAGKLRYNDEQEACFNFGKYKGQTFVSVIEKYTYYIDWMLIDKGNFFTSEFKLVVSRLLYNYMLTIENTNNTLLHPINDILNRFGIKNTYG